jgi:hypothetical protein
VANVTFFNKETNKVAMMFPTLDVSIVEDREVEETLNEGEVIPVGDTILEFLNSYDTKKQWIWEDVVRATNGEGLFIMKLYHIAKTYLDSKENDNGKVN